MADPQALEPSASDTNLSEIVAVGQKKPTKITTTNANTAIDFPTRGISSTGGTVVVVDLTCADGTIASVKLPAPGWFPIINVTNVQGTAGGTDGENILVWPW